MTKIAILEDNLDDAKRLQDYLTQFEKKHANSVSFQVDYIENSLAFLEHYKADYDIIFFDIEMPHLNGMETAKKIYEVDKRVIIIFVTNLEKYAVQGYKVDALGYLLKPLSYPSLEEIISKALRSMEKNAKKEIVVEENGQSIRIALDDLYYVEIFGHYLIYHTVYKDYKMRGKISDIAKELEGDNFIQCHKSFLVNLDHVKSIGQNSLFVEDFELGISRGKKNEFMAGYLSYLSNRNH